MTYLLGSWDAIRIAHNATAAVKNLIADCALVFEYMCLRCKERKASVMRANAEGANVPRGNMKRGPGETAHK